MKKLTGEFCISSTFQHHNIVETIDLVLDDQQRYCTVMEYVSVLPGTTPHVLESKS
jgi:hypothetical protein